MTLGSLFDGSGTAPLCATILGWNPLWASEIEPYPIAVTTARFPKMQHLGSITEINGAEVAPVDVIVGGSPCQDLSVAGKQAGLTEGTRSNLFYEMTRIIREMRGATNGQCPRYVVWENVPGAFSSNQGRDFLAVVEAFCAIADDSVHIPRPAEEERTGRLTWENAGSVVGDGWSFAWRVLDAQYWGVPQRRRRIFAVLDLGSERAGEILFERAGLSRNLEPRREAGEGTTADVVGCIDRGGGVVGVDGYNLTTTGDVSITIRAGKSDQDHVGCVVQEVKCLNPHDSQTMRVYDADGIYPALAANSGGGQNRQAVIYPVGAFCAGAAPAAGSVGYSEQVAPTLKSAQCAFPMGAVVYEPMSLKEENWAEADAKNALRAGASKSSHAVVYPVGAVGSLCARADSSPCIDRGQPFVAYESGQGYWMPGFGCLRAEGENRPSRPSHITVYENHQHGGYRAGCGTLRANGGDYGGGSENLAVYDARGNGNGEVAATLTGDHQNRVTDYTNVACYSQERIGQYTEGVSASTQTARQYKSPTGLVVQRARRYIVRRLTPTECARLQGFPDWWTDGVSGSDSAKYKMWGNGMALPCMLAVLNGICESEKANRRTCPTCAHHLGGGQCRQNLESECGEGEFEAWEPRK